MLGDIRAAPCLRDCLDHAEHYRRYIIVQPQFVLLVMRLCYTAPAETTPICRLAAGGHQCNSAHLGFQCLRPVWSYRATSSPTHADNRMHCHPNAPVDLDIFSAFSSRWPLVRIARGHSSGASGQTAVWLYSANDRWLLIRSLPDTWSPPGQI